jgi:hypothetical protein
MGKFALVCIIAATVYYFDYPILGWWREWVEDIVRFGIDPAFAASYSTTAKLFYALFPLAFVVAGMLWYVLIFRQHRKTYYACGWPQGTVMWVFNKPGRARGHIYDLFSILHGFREIDWEVIPRPWTGDFFDRRVVIYWRASFWQSPFRWNKDMVVSPRKNFHDTPHTIYASGMRRYNWRHPHNPRCDFNFVTDRELYGVQGKDLMTAMTREKALNYQITEDVQRLARANPDVANDMAHRDIPIPRSTRDKLMAAQEAKKDVPAPTPSDQV